VRNARITGWGAAALAAVLVTTAAAPAGAAVLADAATETPAPIETSEREASSSPEPAPSDEPTEAPAEDAPTDDAAPEPLAQRAERTVSAALAAAAVGDLTVTVFEDRYQDGVFDTSKVGRTGQSDAIRQYLGAPTLVASDGSTWTATAVGDTWFFDDVPAGDARLQVQYPTLPVNAMLFDATDPAELRKLTQVGSSWDPRAEASVTIADGTNTVRTIGISGMRAVADVKLPDGNPATGVTVELGANGEWLPATEYDFQLGSYEHLDGGYVYLLPGEFGVRVTAPAGYRVGEVTAVSSGGNIDPIPVTSRDGAYWLQTTDASTYTSNPTFTVTLEKLPTADVRITSFDDRYADGVFDTSKTAKDGRTDETNTRISRLVTAQGAIIAPMTDANGDQVFEDVPVGEAKVYFVHPNSAFDSIFFDATDAESADDIERLPNESDLAYSQAVATVAVAEGGSSIEVGFTALRATAEVEYADGAPVSGVSVELGSDDEWYPATEYDFAGGEGTYEAFANSYYVRHLPDEIGVRVTPPTGYAIAEVTARENNDPGAAEIDVRDDGTVFWLDTADAASYFSAPTFVVTLEEIPTASVDVTYFLDVALDGVYEAGIDTAVPGAEVYLQDAAGDWWATTSVDGTYAFSGIAPGEATVYVEIPETVDAPEAAELPGLELPEAALAVWDATDLASYRDVVEAETTTVSFAGTSIGADGTTTPVVVEDAAVGAIAIEVVADTEGSDVEQVFVGGAAVLQTAAVVDTSSLGSVPGAQVEFLANRATAPGAELAPGSGAFVAAEDDGQVAVFGAAEYGIRPTVPAGFQVVDVVAVSLTGTVLEVTEQQAPPAAGRAALFAAAEYRVAPEQVGGPVGGIVWAVAVAPITVAPPVVPGIDLPPTAGLPAGSPAVLPATGSDLDVWALVFGASLLLAAGLGARLIVRRRTA